MNEPCRNTGLPSCWWSLPSAACWGQRCTSSNTAAKRATRQPPGRTLPPPPPSRRVWPNSRWPQRPPYPVRSLRVPGIEELYSEGPHLASFEVGHPKLNLERGWGAELFARYRRPRLNASGGSSTTASQATSFRRIRAAPAACSCSCISTWATRCVCSEARGNFTWTLDERLELEGTGDGTAPGLPLLDRRHGRRPD